MAVLTWFSCKTMTAILYFGGQKSVHNDGLVTIIMAALKREVLYCTDDKIQSNLSSRTTAKDSSLLWTVC